MKADSQVSFDTVMAFMGAMGTGDMNKMDSLMAEDMVWHNEGDKTLSWIHGDITGKKAIFEFLPVFSSNLKSTKWENTDAFASGDIKTVKMIPYWATGSEVIFCLKINAQNMSFTI